MLALWGVAWMIPSVIVLVWSQADRAELVLALLGFTGPLFMLAVYVLMQHVQCVVAEKTQALEAEEERLQIALSIAEEGRRAAEEESMTDPLTGLFNRRGANLIPKILGAQNRCKCGDCNMAPVTQVAVACIDLDGFKPVNDALGHAQGDSVICLCATLLRQFFGRASDIVIRLGGDEFLVVVAIRNPSDIESIISRLETFRQEFERDFKRLLTSIRKRDESGPALTVTVSSGVYRRCLPSNRVISQDFVDQIIRVADNQMYRAKKAGGNQILVATEAESIE